MNVTARPQACQFGRSSAAVAASRLQMTGLQNLELSPCCSQKDYSAAIIANFRQILQINFDSSCLHQMHFAIVRHQSLEWHRHR